MKAIISRQKAIPRPLVHTPETAEVVVSEDLRGKGVEVNFRRALLEQCQVPRVALFRRHRHPWCFASATHVRIFISEAQKKTIKRWRFFYFKTLSALWYLGQLKQGFCAGDVTLTNLSQCWLHEDGIDIMYIYDICILQYSVCRVKTMNMYLYTSMCLRTAYNLHRGTSSFFPDTMHYSYTHILTSRFKPRNSQIYIYTHT